MQEVLVNRLGGLSLPRKSVVRLTDRYNMTLDVNRGHKTTLQQQQQPSIHDNNSKSEITCNNASTSIFLMLGSGSLIFSGGRYCKSSGNLSTSSSSNSSGPASGNNNLGNRSTSSLSNHSWYSTKDYIC